MRSGFRSALWVTEPSSVGMALCDLVPVRRPLLVNIDGMGHMHHSLPNGHAR